MKKTLLIKIFLWVFSFQLNACSWCESWKNQPDLVNKEIKTNNTDLSVDEKSFLEQFLKDMLDKEGASSAGSENQTLSIDDLEKIAKEKVTVKQHNPKTKKNKNEVCFSKTAAEKFNKEYLLKFYPKALVIIYDYSPDMCADALAAGFHEYVTMLSKEPWQVFKNNSKGFRLGDYWEVILDECRRLHNYGLSRLYVNPVTKKVVLDNRDLFEMSMLFQDMSYMQERKNSNLIPLLTYWQTQNIDVAYNFYALYLDYIVKVFNENIRFETLKQAKEYLYEYKHVLKALPKTMFNSEYHEHSKINSELIAKLKELTGIVKQPSLDFEI